MEGVWGCQHGGCRKVQGEQKWVDKGGGEEDRCRSASSDNGVLLLGGGREREQSASWGRDIGASNKQTTDTNTSAAWGYS